SWGHASIITNTSYDHSEGTYGGFAHDYEHASVTLVVAFPNESHSIVLEDESAEVGGIAHDTAKRRYTMEERGPWLVVTGGAHAWLVEPQTSLVCQHADATRPPTPTELVLDILAEPNKGPLHLDHRGTYEVQHANDYVIAHAQEPEIAAAIVPALSNVADNMEWAAMAQLYEVALRNPETLRPTLDHVRVGHFRMGWLAAEALFDRKDIQVPLANYLLEGTTYGAELYDYREYKILDQDEMFSRDVWDLARLVRRDGATPEAEVAAIAVLDLAAKKLPSAESRAEMKALGTVENYWNAGPDPTAQAAATYALQILVMAHTATARAAIERMDWTRGKASPHTIEYRNPYSDYRKSRYDGETDDWFRWAAEQLER
ncbi:MAG TPA: hypothetical protein VGC41_08800, partial [Kofleriaceae bacterium]